MNCSFYIYVRNHIVLSMIVVFYYYYYYYYNYRLCWINIYMLRHRFISIFCTSTRWIAWITITYFNFVDIFLVKFIEMLQHLYPHLCTPHTRVLLRPFCLPRSNFQVYKKQGITVLLQSVDYCKEKLHIPDKVSGSWKTWRRISNFYVIHVVILGEVIILKDTWKYMTKLK